MANEVKANYSDLDQIASSFSQQSQAVQDMLNKLKSAMDPLQNGGWIGKGSDAFFQEMQELVLPGTQRLMDALDEASQKVKQISQKFHDAEDEAAGPFKQGGAR